MRQTTRMFKKLAALACTLALTLSLAPMAAAYEMGEIVGGDPNCQHEFDNLWAHAVTEKSSCTEKTYSYWLCKKCDARYVCGIHYPQGHKFVNGVCRYCGISQSGTAAADPGVTANPGSPANPGTVTDPNTPANPGSAADPGNPAPSAPETANPGSGSSRAPSLCEQNGHSWQYSKVEPTCTSEGHSCRVCTVCGTEETYAVRQKLPHTWETRTEQPTTTSAGRTYRVCKACGAEETLSTSPVRSTEEQAAYDAMVALKSQYPDGTRWTNSNYYGWKGGIYSGGYGCAGFAFMLSDAAFGSLPARMIKPVSFSDVRVGDIIRVKGDSHSVIVLEVQTDSVVIAEGNMNSSVLWGRTLKKTDVEAATYLITRWPQEGAATEDTAQTTPTGPSKPAESTAPTQQEQPVQRPQQPAEASNPFTDVPAASYYHDAVLWALENGVTTGVTANQFQPNSTCTRGQVVTFLWRASGCPEPKTTVNPFRDVDTSSPFYKAILWAQETGITSGATPTRFAPRDICTSAHVVTFLWRANGKPAAPGNSSLASTYPGQYYTDAVAWADSSGLLSGVDSAFIPGQHSPRANIVTYLYRDSAQ